MHDPSQSRMPVPDFVGKHCRDRSFRGQILNGVSFQGADVQGCNFDSAQLVGANFEAAILGQSPRQTWIYRGWCLGVGLLTLDPLTSLIFNLLGTLPDDPHWTQFVMTLSWIGATGTLAIANLYLPLPYRYKPLVKRIVTTLATSLVVLPVLWDLGGKSLSFPALFFIVLLAGLIGGWFQHQSPRAIVQLAFQVLNLAIAYSFAFWIGTQATQFLSVGRFLTGIPIALLTLLCFKGCWQGILNLRAQIREAPGTTFRNANLTNAKFTDPIRNDATLS